MYRKKKQTRYVGKCNNYLNKSLPNITDLSQMNNGAHMGNSRELVDHMSGISTSFKIAESQKARPMDAKCKRRDPCCVQKYNGHQPSVEYPGCYPPPRYEKECINPCVPRCMKLGVCKTVLSTPCKPCDTCCMGPNCYIVPRHEQYRTSPMVFPCSNNIWRVNYNY